MSRKEHLYHFIYKTIDTRNGNFYIGMHSTDNLNDGYVGSGDRLRKLIHKHGKEIFKIEILEFLPNRESLKKREEEIVNSDLLKEEKCMNLKPGGCGGLNNEEHKKKFVEAGHKAAKLVGNKAAVAKVKELFETNPKWVENFKNSLKGKKKCDWTGRKHSSETKEKMSLSAKGKHLGQKNSQYGSMWITNGIENKKIKIIDEIPVNWYRGRTIKQ